jgi:hypothetical protein
MSVEVRTPRSTVSAVLPFRAIPNRLSSGEEDKPSFLGDLLARIFRQFGGGPTGSGSFIPIGAC